MLKMKKGWFLCEGRRGKFCLIINISRKLPKQNTSIRKKIQRHKNTANNIAHRGPMLIRTELVILCRTNTGELPYSDNSYKCVYY